MRGTHHHVSRPSVAIGSDEFGRLGWLVLGSSALLAGAVAHALSGVISIARGTTSPASASDRPARPAALTLDEKEGWFLIGALFLVTGAMVHSFAHVIRSVRAVVHPTAHPQVRA
ncbi:hypothetical protein AB0D10_15675 [Kitasatospora sp. NPDC048545]|uniref:hypothetical protein n=1 Tax=Kitasatospora sp. NPDC048545 TaxID=3157208 RepID=UPI0033E711FC